MFAIMEPSSLHLVSTSSFVLNAALGKDIKWYQNPSISKKRWFLALRMNDMGSKGDQASLFSR
jgi:hypothetical protein